jgi:hypothetical protein
VGLAYMFVVSLRHGSSAGSSEWWLQFRQVPRRASTESKGRGMANILCSRSTAAQTGDGSNGRSTRYTPNKSLSPTLHPLSPFLPRLAGKAAPGNQPRTLGTRTKPHTRTRTRMTAGVRIHPPSGSSSSGSGFPFL